MSRSYRDKERLENRKADKEIMETINSLTPDVLSEKYAKSKKTKRIYRFGNDRKAYAKIKVQERRLQRRKDNNINDDF